MPSPASAPMWIASTAGLSWVRAIVWVLAPLFASDLIPIAAAASRTVWSPIAENPQSAPTRLYPFDVTVPAQSPPVFPASIEAEMLVEARLKSRL